MRSSKSRSRNKSNRQRSLGNVVNRVFDSSGPEGKVRGTPQQIIDKYLMLARDAQLSNDRVAEQSFLQHAEHYTRMLGEAQREMAERHQQFQQNQRSDDERDNRDGGNRDNGQRDSQNRDNGGGDNGNRQYGGRENGQRDGGNRDNAQFESAREGHVRQSMSGEQAPVNPPVEVTEQPRPDAEERTRQPRTRNQPRPRMAKPVEIDPEQTDPGMPSAVEPEERADTEQFPEAVESVETSTKAPRKRKTPVKAATRTPRRRKSEGDDTVPAPEQPGDTVE